MGIFILLFYVLPATQSATQVTLTYSQFMSDVSAHKVKTVTINTDWSATGTLSNGDQYTTAIPTQAGQPFLDELPRTAFRSRRRPRAPWVPTS